MGFESSSGDNDGTPQQQLAKIENKISDVKSRLETLRKEGAGSDLSQKQILELERELQKLQKRKKEIIIKTQGSLNLAKSVSLPRLEKYIPTEDSPQRKKVISAISKVKNPEDIANLDFVGDALALTLSLLKVAFGGVWGSNEKGEIIQTESEPTSLNRTKKMLKNPDRKIQDFDFYTLLETKEGKKFKQYENSILRWTRRIGNINPGLLLKLFIKEGSRGNVSAGPGGKSSAKGLGQITDNNRKNRKGTWTYICEDIGPKEYNIYLDPVKDRYNPEAQIIGACIYLDYCAKLRKVTHREAVVYYHRGPGKVSDEKARSNIKVNPAIARAHDKIYGKKAPVTSESYDVASNEYYLA